MTAIRRVIRRQYYRKLSGACKRQYDRIRFRLEFPSNFDVSHLVDKELEFVKIGDEVRLKPRKPP